jgi:hypothetical protein
MGPDANRARADGVLLVYHRPVAGWMRDASTVMEHVGSFGRHSRHRIWEVNTDTGLPPQLRGLAFKTVILHYSVFGMLSYALDADWLEYLTDTPAYKVAFFQDECTRCQRRFRFLNEYEIDCVYTCLEPSEFEKVYRRYTQVPKLVSNVPGYVSEELPEIGRRCFVPDEQREMDVGYRGRPLPAYLGRGAMEKHEIGVRFAELARGAGLRLDVAAREGDRLYGDDWYRFMANCRCVLGVESGVSAFDLEDEVFEEYTRLVREGRTVGVEHLTTLPRWEDVVYYRTISPRHFEAAALRVCQILFEGRYSGAMEPMVHYIPLKKDFSNIEEVLRLSRDPAVRRELTENAHRDLIESSRWRYAALIDGVDSVIEAAPPGAELPAADDEIVAARLNAGLARRRRRRVVEWAIFTALRWEPVNRVLRRFQPFTSRVRRALGIRGQDAVA